MNRGVIFVCALAACGGDDAGGPDPCLTADDPCPAAEDIDFAALEELPSGEWLLANDWAPTPNVAFVLPIDDLGAARREIFAANRVWSMGAAADGSSIYFSAWDAQQEEHFGITIGDAIQNSFSFTPSTSELRALAWGNLNDECQVPSPDGDSLYVCRRYDFTPEGAFSGWRIGRISLDDRSFEFLRGDAAGPYELSPQPLPDGATVLLELRARPPATDDTLVLLDLASGDETDVRTSAGRPILFPDGHRVLFQDRTDQSRWKMLDLDSSAPPVTVSPTTGAGDAAISPDGDTIVYAVFDSTLSCDHLERVTFSGTWSAPTRVRDCAQTGEFITDLDWIVVP
jgi:Tol biopolymer transport system component